MIRFEESGFQVDIKEFVLLVGCTAVLAGVAIGSGGKSAKNPWALGAYAGFAYFLVSMIAYLIICVLNQSALSSVFAHDVSLTLGIVAVSVIAAIWNGTSKKWQWGLLTLLNYLWGLKLALVAAQLLFYLYSTIQVTQ